MKLTVDGKTFDVSVGGDEITVDGRTFRVRTEGRGPRKTVYVDEQPFRIETPDDLSGEFQVNVDAKLRSVKLAGAAAAVRRAAPAERRAAAPKAAVKGGVVATMAGRILRVAVEEGQAVQSGDLLLIFE
ncbi:MAG TPA: biotin/lipoyl-binding protein, partial [Dehalococcoidia bacterium]|nr:biotin/lipoyl-binding protein [Dehalococcoidia bacterium]